MGWRSYYVNGEQLLKLVDRFPLKDKLVRSQLQVKLIGAFDGIADTRMEIEN